jgi:REP element-mobilizing transposase RayT
MKRKKRDIEFGGAHLIGARRSRRPLSKKIPLHIVLRSDYAYGSRILLRHRHLINKIIKRSQRRFEIKVYEKAIVHNHIHLLIKGQHRGDIQNFFRVVAGHIAQEILRQNPIKLVERKIHGECPAKTQNKFWQSRIFSRIVSWGKDFDTVCNYIIRNALEALSLIPYKFRNYFFLNTG